MELRKRRGDFLGVAAADTGKIFTETDVEVSEAVDFAEFHPWSVQQFDNIKTVSSKGKGVGLVISPWNFPVAIPCGGLVAALSAGNSVIFKPSTDAVLTAWQLYQCFWSPGIKYGVEPGSYDHMTEFFGPLLSVMCAMDLTHVIELINQTGYGLTSGIESLDRREQQQWQDTVFAGNLYINRGTTGAITLRQPFGGIGKSALGPGIKAGSPDYVGQFMEFKEHDKPLTGVINKECALLRLANEWETMVHWGAFGENSADIAQTVAAIKSYLYHMKKRFGRNQDFFHLRGQDNILRYLPITDMLIRVHADDSLFETLARIAAAKVAGCNFVVSLPKGLDNDVTSFLENRYGRALLKNKPVICGSDKQLANNLHSLERIRYAAPDRVPAEIFQAASENGFFIARTPVYMEGRLEMLHYFKQQSICNNYHRYGNLGKRSDLE